MLEEREILIDDHFFKINFETDTKVIKDICKNCGIKLTAEIIIIIKDIKDSQGLPIDSNSELGKRIILETKKIIKKETSQCPICSTSEINLKEINSVDNIDPDELDSEYNDLDDSYDLDEGFGDIDLDDFD